MTVFFATPVIRTVARIEHPSALTQESTSARHESSPLPTAIIRSTRRMGRLFKAPHNIGQRFATISALPIQSSPSVRRVYKSKRSTDQQQRREYLHDPE